VLLFVEHILLTQFGTYVIDIAYFLL